MPSHNDLEVHELKEELLKEHEGDSVEDFFDGEELETKYGPCYKITNHTSLKLNTLKQDKAKNRILNDLKLLNGIGESRERTLNQDGYKNLRDLVEHPRFGESASTLLEVIDESDASRLSECISCRYPKSHPLMLCSSVFHETENLVFMDIETMGLKDVPLILIGVAEMSGDDVEVNQYLLRNLHEENAAIEGFLSHLHEKSVFVTFNGQTFDVPYIKNRMYYYGIKQKMTRDHLDLMHFSRRAWSDELPNCQLQTLEKYLFGMERHGDVPSSKVPSFYKTYLETGNIGPLVPIVEHNREDVVTLVKLLSRLYDEVEV
ncbi:RNase_H superfamily protein [anaerobic digester metagenome]